MKGAPTIEALGQARTVLFDKTGTLTVGTPEVREVLPANGLAPVDLLQLAASLTSTAPTCSERRWYAPPMTRG